jgi:quinohemoprotein ethanol dehydrogenase
VVAAPATYEVDGQQYVSIAVGWGGVYGLAARHSDGAGPGTVYTFALGAKAKMPEFVEYRLGQMLKGVAYDPKDVPAGTALYVQNCAFCHGVPAVDRGGNIPNLGYSAPGVISNLKEIVLSGALSSRGMPNFQGKLSEAEVEKIKAFIQGTADAVRPK